MSIGQAVTAMVGTYGEAFTIRKAGAAAGPNAWTAGAQTPAYVHCKGRERRSTPKGQRSGGTEVGSLIVIDAATCATEPKKGDRIAPGTWSGDAGAEWHQITDVYGAREGASIRVWRLEVSK